MASSDQTLTKVNAAIAKNCHAEFDDKNGGEAGKNWKKEDERKVGKYFEMNTFLIYVYFRFDLAQNLQRLIFKGGSCTTTAPCSTI